MTETTKTQEELNSDKINLNNFFYLLANTKETKKCVESLKEFLEEYYSFNSTQYNRLNELYSKYFTKNRETKLVNISIYKIETLITDLVKGQLDFIKPLADNFEIISLISSKLENLETIIEECSVKFFNFAYNGAIFNDTNSIFNSMMKSMSDLETKIVDEYIWENYKKHTSETPEQKVEDLISHIKDLERKMYNYTKETKSKHYCQIKESNDKIQSIYSDIMIQWGNNISFYKENAKSFIKKLEGIENKINPKEKNEETINEENIIFSKSDFEINENDFYSVKYKIKIIKNNKIPLKKTKEDINQKDEKKIKEKKHKINKSKNHQNKNENDLLKKKFDEDYLYLNEKDTYNIITKIYNYDLKILDKSFYVLDIEKGKLDAMEIANQILKYNEDESKINLLNEKYNELIELINTKIVNNMANIEGFFIVLNNYRAKGNIKFSNKFFDLMIYIYTKAQDLLLKSDNKRIQELLLILSQTYYKEVDKKKIYILEAIKSHELYKNIDFWKNIILKKIEDEYKRIRKFNSSNKINQEKKEEIISTNLISFSGLMKEFDFNNDKIIELIKQIFDKNKCSEECRKQVLIFVNQN